MLHSHYLPLATVTMPAFAGRQLYMGGFDLANPVMPAGYEDYLDVVNRLCAGAGAFEGKAYMTVDEKVIEPGMSQRRPGPHVDGQYLTHARDWSHPSPGWNHSCNAVPMARMPVIVAATAFGTRVWSGDFDIQPDSGGDLTPHLAVLGEGIVTEPNRGYWLSPDCVHESLVVDAPTQRSFIRIALPTQESSNG